MGKVVLTKYRDGHRYLSKMVLPALPAPPAPSPPPPFLPSFLYILPGNLQGHIRLLTPPDAPLTHPTPQRTPNNSMCVFLWPFYYAYGNTHVSLFFVVLLCFVLLNGINVRIVLCPFSCFKLCHTRLPSLWIHICKVMSFPLPCK